MWTRRNINDFYCCYFFYYDVSLLVVWQTNKETSKMTNIFTLMPELRLVLSSEHRHEVGLCPGGGCTGVHSHLPSISKKATRARGHFAPSCSKCGNENPILIKAWTNSEGTQYQALCSKCKQEIENEAHTNPSKLDIRPSSERQPIISGKWKQ